jgi:hypothetical protein
MDQIICTQDVPGERAWLESCFPNYKNLQTEFSGMWPNNKLILNNTNCLWEIPPDSDIKLDQILSDKILSLYKVNDKFIDPRWCQTEKLITNLNFDSESNCNQKLAQVITFSRAGTVFLEKLLYTHLGYKELTPHLTLGAGFEEQCDVLQLITDRRPDVFLVYRNNWWEWATSVFISRRTGWIREDGKYVCPHGYHTIDWSQIEPFSVTADELSDLHNWVFASWNAFCDLRSKCRDLNFYLLEFSDLIQIKKEKLDSKIVYNKKDLIENYSTLKELFVQQYLPLFHHYQTNAVQHLKTMKCNMSIDSLIESK